MTSPAPEGPALVVSVGAVADRLGIETPSPRQQRTIAAALADAQAAVEAHLGQPITPRLATDTGCWPYDTGWRLTYPPLTVVSAVADTWPDGTLTGTFTVTYTYGLDAAADPDLSPIRRYVMWAALNDPAIVTDWQAAQGTAARRLTSVSTEGQSASWQYLTPTGSTSSGTGAADATPAPPTLASLDRWRVAGRRVFQRRTPPPPAFGYDMPGRWP